MAKIRLCEISGGKVANIAVADDQNIPPHMASWVPEGPGATVGGTYDGSTFGPIPQSDIDSAQDAEIEKIVDQVIANKGGIRALALAVFGIYDRLAAAGVSGFPTLTNAQKRQFIKDRI